MENLSWRSYNTLIKPIMSYGKYISNIANFLLHFFIVLSFCTFYLKFCWIFPESFPSLQIYIYIYIYIYILSHGIMSALENKELICHFRVYGKSAKSAQTGGQISIDGSFKKSL